MLTELEVDGDNTATVAEYLRRVTLPGMTTKCGCCKRKLQLLMIIPCGHLCCADCVEDRYNQVGSSCLFCSEVYNPEVFQELQPGFNFREVDDSNDKNRNTSSQQNPQRQAPRPNRHYWTVDASKIFYAATRVRELKKEFGRRSAIQGLVPSQRTRYVKVIIFSQFTEIIWRTKLAFEQQKIPTANFITRVTPKARMKALKRFRTDPSLNVLLLSEIGSHGLNLSFVTHVFLMEEIWDKSLEQQVISRAHRMGAQQAVEVEQLWMRGSVESEMAKVNELDESEVDPPPIVHDLGPPVRTRKRKRGDRNALLNVAGKKKRNRNRQGDAKKVPTGNKSSFLQRKLDYVLNHLRMLDSSVTTEPQQVRFSVVDEKNGSTIRQVVHRIRSSGSPDNSSSSLPIQPRDRTSPGAHLALSQNTTMAQAARVAQSIGNTVANGRTAPPNVPATTRAASSHVQEHSRHNQQALPQTKPQTKSTAKAVAEREKGTAQAQNAVAMRNTGAAAQPARSKPNSIVCTTTRVTQHPARPTSSTSVSPRPPRPEDIVVIENDPVNSRISATKESTSGPEIIVIDDSSSSGSESSSSDESEGDGDVNMSSSSSCIADNEEHFDSEDSDADSGNSDEEAKALLSRLIHTAQRHFALRQTSQSNDARPAGTLSTPSPVVKAEPVPEIDDEESDFMTVVYPPPPLLHCLSY